MKRLRRDVDAVQREMASDVSGLKLQIDGVTRKADKERVFCDSVKDELTRTSAAEDKKEISERMREAEHQRIQCSE